MPKHMKASLVAEEDDQQTRSELEAYQEREHARRARAAVIRAVKEDMQDRRSMPDVSEPTTYEVGDEGQIPVIVKPRDEDGMVEVCLDTTGDGEIDAVLHFDKKKKLRDITDMHSQEYEEERKAREREEREREAESKEESEGLSDMLEGKTPGQSADGGLVGGLFSGDAEEDSSGKRRRDDDDDDEEKGEDDDKKDDYAQADADAYAKMQPLTYLHDTGDKRKHKPDRPKSVDVTYAKRRRRGRRRSRYPSAILR